VANPSAYLKLRRDYEQSKHYPPADLGVAKPVAKPDSRFHLNFAEGIPDFEGSEKVIDRLVAQPTSRRGKCMVSSAVLKRFAPLARACRTVVSDRAMYIIS
jgi:hypothetical protein